MDARLVKLSRFMSYVLRHRPDVIGIELDEAGWADVDELIQRMQEAGKRVDRARLQEVVETNDKRRFSLSEDGRRIRAAQGHSIPVMLGLEPTEPPAELFHGTASRFLDAILGEGLVPKGRRHVHLSADRRTAVEVGRRHGRPVVLRVASGSMAEQGAVFYLADNGVWLCEKVEPRFLVVLDEGGQEGRRLEGEGARGQRPEDIEQDRS
jgi:putative RNA 2'-phosphotransferase